MDDAVHPHRCGENESRPRRHSGDDGSPPQVWGKLINQIDGTQRTRFTPTGVGKTDYALIAANVRWFTPTGVGKTSTHPIRSRSMPVHPHRCGENCVRLTLLRGKGGSPPQVWGKLAPTTDGPAWRRFTPTGVGKTSSGNLQGAPMMVHPHRCGENRLRKMIQLTIPGSPPQVWGKRDPQFAARDGDGFTPTGVGKTTPEICFMMIQKVHPHRCGENAWRRRRLFISAGSPPQVWGKQSPPSAAIYTVGFTPTGVGKTQSDWTGLSHSQVHPHRCGENFESSGGPSCATGSPPQVWGKHAILTR